MRYVQVILSVALVSAALAGCGGYYGNRGYNSDNAYGYNNNANWGQPPLHSHGEGNYPNYNNSNRTCWNCGN